jgi:hypothetical protein
MGKIVKMIFVALLAAASQAFSQDYIFWTDTRDTSAYRGTLDTQDVTQIFKGPPLINAIFVTNDTETLYVTGFMDLGERATASGIIRMTYSGTDTHAVVLDYCPFGKVEDLYDWRETGQLLWLSSCAPRHSHIRRFHADSTSFYLPACWDGVGYGFTINPITNEAYFAIEPAYARQEIYKVKLDSLAPYEFESIYISTANSQIFDVELDLDANKIYWSETHGIIGRANLDGSEAEIIISDLPNAFGIALDVDGGNIYWAQKTVNYDEGFTGAIMRANLDGTDIEEVFGNLNAPHRIALSFSKVWLGVENKQVLTEFSLAQNYPNPFNPETVMQYSLPEPSFVTLKVFNLKGQLVRTLLSKKQQSGLQEVTWDGKSDSGISLPTGTYIYRLQVDDFTDSRKLILLR